MKRLIFFKNDFRFNVRFVLVTKTILILVFNAVFLRGRIFFMEWHC